VRHYNQAGCGERVALAKAEHEFIQVLHSASEWHVPVLGTIVCDYDIADDSLCLRASFHDRSHVDPTDSREYVQHVIWRITRHEIEECQGWDNGAYVRECRSLYSRLYEDHLLELELAPRREAMQRALRIDPDPTRSGWVVREYQEFEAHVRRHHSRDRMYAADLRGGMVERLPYQDPSRHIAEVEQAIAGMRTAIDAQTYQAMMGGQTSSTATAAAQMQETAAARPTITAESLRQLRRLTDLHARVHRGAYRAQPSRQIAQAKGMDLLKSWLTPDQLASYEKTKAFEVVGSDTGKRYRIRQGRQMNIDELDSKGEKACGWCFLPEGGLVEGDCMVAQKIALETNETAALKVANRFGDTQGRGHYSMQAREMFYTLDTAY
jgi:hypothetical protein